MGMDANLLFFSPIHLELVDDRDEIEQLDSMLDIVPETKVPPRILKKTKALSAYCAVGGAARVVEAPQQRLKHSEGLGRDRAKALALLRATHQRLCVRHATAALARFASGASLIRLFPELGKHQVDEITAVFFVDRSPQLCDRLLDFFGDLGSLKL
jgi:hypothetical protein